MYNLKTMTTRYRCIFLSSLVLIFASLLVLHAQGINPQTNAVQKLIAAIMGPSPIEENLRRLSDEVGGRVPGTEGNRQGVAWALESFRKAGVDSVHTEKFTIPASWAEGDTRLEILAPIRFTPRVVSIAWSPATPAGGIEANVVDVGEGSEDEFTSAGIKIKGSLVLVHSVVLHSWYDLMNEYFRAGPIIDRAVKAGASGILWMSSREQKVLYRHINVYRGQIDQIPQALVSREDALLMSRFATSGQPIRARLSMPNQIGGPIEVENVIAEIRGTDKANEVVMIGAHLDSWELGTGALDNGANCALVVDIARAIRAAGITSRRTLRFALWNGEEQGLLGSWAYAHDHRSELDNMVAFLNLDGGTGAVTGWSLGGRADTIDAVREVVAPIESWGMNEHSLDISGGSDHLDFLFEGVPTLCANQIEANYLVNYHAFSDTLEKVDLFALKRHAAFAAVTMIGIANRDKRIGPRQTHAQIKEQILAIGFDAEMKAFDQWEDFIAGKRGRQP